jgi:hypothetical protein
MRTAHKPTYSYLILTIALILINMLVARYVAIRTPYWDSILPIFYPAVVLMILFTLWFGAYGAIAAYIGCFAGAGLLAGIPPDVALYWSFADLFQVLIPLAAVRILQVNPDLRTRRDLLCMFLFAVLINNAVGAAWGAVTLAIGNVISWGEVVPLFAGWFTGNAILTTLLLLPALYFLTPAVRGSRLFVREFWN